MTACYLAVEVDDSLRSYFSAAHRNGTDRQWWLPYRFRRGSWLRCEDKAGPTIMPTCYRSIDEARVARDEIAESHTRPISIVHATTGEVLDRSTRRVPSGAPICTESVR